MNHCVGVLLLMNVPVKQFLKISQYLMQLCQKLGDLLFWDHHVQRTFQIIYYDILFTEIWIAT